MVAVPLQVAAVLVQAVPEVVVLVVGAAVDLGVQGDHCSPSSPSARLGAVADVRAEELALVAVLAPAAQAQALVVPDPVALAQVALAQVMVRHHRHRQRNQTQPQSRLQAIWIATKSQTLEMVRSDPALNQLG